MPTSLITDGQLQIATAKTKEYVLKELLVLTNAIEEELSPFTGATANQGGASGFVPAPDAGDDEKFLRGDGQWAVPEGGGGFILGSTSSTVEGAMWLED